MTRLATQQQRLIVERFQEGYAIPILAVIWMVTGSRIESLIRQAMKEGR